MREQDTTEATTKQFTEQIGLFLPHDWHDKMTATNSLPAPSAILALSCE